MRQFKFLLIIVLLMLSASIALPAPWSGSGTYTVGTAGDYATLGDFFFAMTGFKQPTGRITTSAALGTTVLGTDDCKFLTEVNVGDTVIIPNTGGTNFEGRTVAAVVNDRQLTLGSAPTNYLTTRSCEIYRAPASAVTGAVIVEVKSDITEPNDIPLIVDLAGNTLTIKPQASQTPTVTFARAEDHNGGNAFSGHFMLGLGTVAYTELFNLVDNVTIDGSNSGGTSRDMTWVVAGNYDYENIIHVGGKNDNIVIKNMNLYNNTKVSGGSGTNYVRFTTRNYTAPSGTGLPITFPVTGTYEPDAWKVLNCICKRTDLVNGKVAHQAINSTNSGTMPAGIRQDNFEVKDNYIEARLRGVALGQGAIGSVERNTIIVTGASAFLTHGIYVINAASPVAPATANYNYNYIDVSNPMYATANQGPRGMSMTSLGSGTTIVYNIIGNMIVLRCPWAGAPTTALQDVRGIYCSSAVGYNIWHNSVMLPEIPNCTGQTSVQLYGVGGWANGHLVSLKNNIIRVREAGAACIARPNTTGTFDSNQNDLYADAGAYIGREGATDYNFAGWQGLGAGHDLNSANLDPLNVWLAETALHLGAGANSSWCAPALPGGPTVDIDGEARASSPFRGADEARLATATFTPGSYDFGLIAKEATKSYAALQINDTSVTSPTLVVYGVNVTGPDAAKFTATPTSLAPIRIPAGGNSNTWLTIVYNPGGVNNASHSATISPIANVGSPTLPLTAGTYNDVATIAAAHAAGTGTVRITDSVCTVTCPTNGLNAGRNQFAIQDDSSGDGYCALWVDDPSNVAAQAYALADVIPANTIIGTLADYHGLLQITPYVAWAAPSAGGTLPTPVLVGPGITDFETIESELVRVNSADITQTGTWAANNNYTLIAPLGRQIDTIRIEDNSGAVGQTIPGGFFDVIGIAIQYDTSKEIEPRYSSDIITPATRVADWSLFH
jgi:hypothetical protein